MASSKGNILVLGHRVLRAIDIDPCLEPINIGVTEGVSVAELSTLNKEVICYDGGALQFYTAKSVGAAYKMVDGSTGNSCLAGNREPTCPPLSKKLFTDT